MGSPYEDFKFLLFIRSSVLPVRVGAELFLKPYYPNRFSCQFGFDQAILSNHLSISPPMVKECDRSYISLCQSSKVRCGGSVLCSSFLLRRKLLKFRKLWATVVPRRNLQYHPLKKEKPSIPTSLASLFYNLKEDWARESILKGVEVIIDIIFNHGSTGDLLASRARVSQSLSALRSMIEICKLNIIEICWLSSKIEEIFSVVEIGAKIKELMNVDQVKLYLTKISLLILKLLTLKLNNLSNEASKLQVKEWEVLRADERIRKIKEQAEVLSRFEEKGNEIGKKWLKLDFPSCRIWRRRRTI
ncbi:LOW QUALITY PROTEIN: hypothetical protein Cgig2_021707 [Carnegiea gigantea]|uniref:Uncharacterized protein n=1 Tax=Carnegiea gigantea TaxID=171969 RepID=A0A9Q1KTE4_9CARY|nr:LOW QUALITY PROTEIN: hypothetical protein Cgig2_021707 [Carnegiea gigantea]